MPYGLTYKQMLSVWNRINIVLDEDSCWEWQKGVSEGYGIVKINYRKFKVHRLIYAQIFGEFDSKLFVCHTCDNRKCARPSHLFLGTAGDNNRDRDKKGRSRGGSNFGDTNPMCKIPDATVLEIRRLYEVRENGKRKYTQKMLAEKFELNREYVNQIINKRVRTNI